MISTFHGVGFESRQQNILWLSRWLPNSQICILSVIGLNRDTGNLSHIYISTDRTCVSFYLMNCKIRRNTSYPTSFIGSTADPNLTISPWGPCTDLIQSLQFDANITRMGLNLSIEQHVRIKHHFPYILYYPRGVVWVTLEQFGTYNPNICTDISVQTKGHLSPLPHCEYIYIRWPTRGRTFQVPEVSYLVHIIFITHRQAILHAVTRSHRILAWRA